MNKDGKESERGDNNINFEKQDRRQGSGGAPKKTIVTNAEPTLGASKVAKKKD